MDKSLCWNLKPEGALAMGTLAEIKAGGTGVGRQLCVTEDKSWIQRRLPRWVKDHRKSAWYVVTHFDPVTLQMRLQRI